MKLTIETDREDDGRWIAEVSPARGLPSGRAIWPVAHHQDEAVSTQKTLSQTG